MRELNSSRNAANDGASGIEAELAACAVENVVAAGMKTTGRTKRFAPHTSGNFQRRQEHIIKFRYVDYFVLGAYFLRPARGAWLDCARGTKRLPPTMLFKFTTQEKMTLAVIALLVVLGFVGSVVL